MITVFRAGKRRQFPDIIGEPGRRRREPGTCILKHCRLREKIDLFVVAGWRAVGFEVIDTVRSKSLQREIPEPFSSITIVLGECCVASSFMSVAVFAALAGMRVLGDLVNDNANQNTLVAALFVVILLVVFFKIRGNEEERYSKTIDRLREH